MIRAVREDKWHTRIIPLLLSFPFFSEEATAVFLRDDPWDIDAYMGLFGVFLHGNEGGDFYCSSWYIFLGCALRTSPTHTHHGLALPSSRKTNDPHNTLPPDGAHVCYLCFVYIYIYLKSG